MSEHRPMSNGVSESNVALDERLRGLFRPPPEERLARIAGDAVQAVSAPPPPHRKLVFRRFAAAAAVLGGIVGIWLIGRTVGPAPGDGYTPPAWQSLGTAYHEWLAEGFEPMWVCADDREFIDSFRSTYYQGLVLDELPRGTTALGLSYCNSISARTTALLATVDGVPVVVFIDRIERDHPQPTPAGLHLHRRQIGRLILYELSPREEPAVLPWFLNPDGGGS